jgi:hypothetical protein
MAQRVVHLDALVGSVVLVSAASATLDSLDLDYRANR